MRRSPSDKLSAVSHPGLPLKAEQSMRACVQVVWEITSESSSGTEDGRSQLKGLVPSLVPL